MGPLPWKVMHDEVLVLSVPKEDMIISFADDLVTIFVAKQIDAIAPNFLTSDSGQTRQSKKMF